MRALALCVTFFSTVARADGSVPALPALPDGCATRLAAARTELARGLPQFASARLLTSDGAVVLKLDRAPWFFWVRVEPTPAGAPSAEWSTTRMRGFPDGDSLKRRRRGAHAEARLLLRWSAGTAPRSASQIEERFSAVQRVLEPAAEACLALAAE